MSNNEKRVNPENNKSREQAGESRKSYDTIPQPTGKFKDLFRQIQDNQKAKDASSAMKDSSTK